jgi:hypothetical protein
MNLAGRNNAFRYIASDDLHNAIVQPPRSMRINPQDGLETLLRQDFANAYGLMLDDERFRQIDKHPQDPAHSNGAERWKRMQSLFAIKKLECG